MIKRLFSQKVTMIKGIYSGPELADAVEKAFEIGNFPVEFEKVDILNLKNENCINKIKKNKFLFAGNIGDIETGNNENLQLFKILNLYANVIHFKSLPNTNCLFKNVDTIVVRENLEGEYSMKEKEYEPNCFQSVKLITEKNSTQISEFAFDLAKQLNRKKITVVHKANIMKLVDGLFLSCTRKISEKNKEIEYDEIIVDNCSMQVVRNPNQFDVLLAPNLFGGIIMGALGALVSGPGVEKGFYYGTDYELFCQGLRVTGNKVIGKANPTGSLLSAANMLKRMGLDKESEILENSVMNVFNEGIYIPKSLGGKYKKKDLLERIFEEIRKLK